MSRKLFGTLPSGDLVYEYTLKNSKGIAVHIISYGATITRIEVARKDGTTGNVVLGFDTLEGYLGSHPYFGVTVGRVGNRIAKGKFTLEGKEYTLAVNNGKNALHGGLKGFDKVNWSGQTLGDNKVAFMYISVDGEEGYPGTLTSTVIFALDEEGALSIAYHATTDKTTIINLTNHSYFNFAAPGESDILGHILHAPKCPSYVPVNDELIPTGALAPVQKTPFDFSSPKPIGLQIGEVEGGYDHTLVIDRSNASPSDLVFFASVSEGTSGRKMEVYTTEPGCQFYTGNFLDGSVVGREGKGYGKWGGFCLETQHYPDAINQLSFPSVVLSPHEQYRSRTVYKFFPGM